MKQETNPFPKTKLQWLWENMRAAAGFTLWECRHRGLQHFTADRAVLFRKDRRSFLTGENARENLSTHRDLFYQLILAMVLFTLLRCVIVYGVCMIYEHVSQTVLYRVRNYLYDKIQRQDMTFYSTYRTLVIS